MSEQLDSYLEARATRIADEGADRRRGLTQREEAVARFESVADSVIGPRLEGAADRIRREPGARATVRRSAPGNLDPEVVLELSLTGAPSRTQLVYSVHDGRRADEVDVEIRHRTRGQAREYHVALDDLDAALVDDHVIEAVRLDD
jgi:hypothetical protein